ncbi:MAG TPA: NAD(P)/FAD-dependent oxidoreductase [Verrucomicrobiae bacterium]|nr:NAD(P)/FAD-dependent oxidoreductase [Verrucomicrobiae bacterium]
MPPTKFKVVIVGGGPAGSSAARTLSASGIEVCLIDKNIFPREKLCGGLLTLRSQKTFQKIFAADWSPVIHRRSTGASFYFKDKFLNSVTDHKDIFFTCRREFDAFLLGLAEKSGAKIMLGKQVQRINLEQSTLLLSDGQEVAFDILIGADGVNSAVAKSLFGDSFKQNKIGFGFEMEIPVSSTIPTVKDPEIYFGLLDWGYGWVFPKRDTLTVGVGGLLRASPKMKADFETFLKNRFGHLPPAKIKGHFIPFGDFRPTPGRGNVLLCGDAAGLVEPITGEGIAFAMLSGSYAGESAKEAIALGQEKSALDCYRPRYASIAAIFQQANRLKHFMFPGLFQRLLSKALSKSESIPRRQMDLMADDLSYPAFTRFLLAKGITGPIKSLFKTFRNP